MSPANPRKAFLWVTVTVFAAAFGLSALLTWLRPRSYAGVARVEVKGLAGPGDATAALQAQAEAALSDAVLNPVVERLDLNESWGRKMRVVGALKTWESVTLLKQKLTVVPVEGPNALEIRMDYADNSEEAAQIANVVADTYCAMAAKNLLAEVSLRAQPDARPAHPNIPLSLALEALGGLGLALAAGAAAGWFVSQLNSTAAKNVVSEKTT
jgi:uncharacterized protein involved in exopolysaccharide biosynthesis